ncbi:hypothetical protein BWQ96_10264 [Gracilariopsis chorda]|uniref:Uncharacterized protein n=1 Tax=Gracilariopsis chorda TaxID=448386 RepID=A0A2V3IFS9_9FLOR|nr:hypothetical protein BWQ96_10264 [Gracilariopsis chorda]|eukprot:PXF40030.1 hypothetical protein BWQ96_10264 [Gracilariopsis chorda]
MKAKAKALLGVSLQELLTNSSFVQDLRKLQHSNVILQSCPDDAHLLELFEQRERDLWTSYMEQIRARVCEAQKTLHCEAEPEDLLLLRHKPNGVPKFTLDEFARLALVIKDDETARKAIMKAVGLPLDRQELDDRVGRDEDFSVVADRFNDQTLSTIADLSNVLEKVDPSRMPVVKRSPFLLKRHYQEARKDFTYF